LSRLEAIPEGGGKKGTGPLQSQVQSPFYPPSGTASEMRDLGFQMRSPRLGIFSANVAVSLFLVEDHHSFEGRQSRTPCEGLPPSAKQLRSMSVFVSFIFF